MKSAILVIDVQNRLVTPAPKPFEIDKVIQKINYVTKLARAKHAPVIFIQHECPDSILEYGSKGWQLSSEIEVDATDHIVRKTTPDSFLRTNLNGILDSSGIKSLIITGYASEFCVDTTVRKGASLGYSIQLVADAHTTHDKGHASAHDIRKHHNATLPNLTSFGSKITSIPANEIEL